MEQLIDLNGVTGSLPAQIKVKDGAFKCLHLDMTC